MTTAESRGAHRLLSSEWRVASGPLLVRSTRFSRTEGKLKWELFSCQSVIRPMVMRFGLRR